MLSNFTLDGRLSNMFQRERSSNKKRKFCYYLLILISNVFESHSSNEQNHLLLSTV